MNEPTISPEALARVRELCLALPESTEKEAWGDPTWRVRNKIFVMSKGNYAGGRPQLWMKAADGAQALLVASDAGRYFIPPYVGHKGWIGVYMDGAELDWDALAVLIGDAWGLIAPKTVVRRYEADRS